MKTLLTIGAILVVLFVGAVAVVTANLGKMIKAGVETMGPEITGTSIKLDGVDLSLLSGQGELKGLVVGNPKGFHAETAFKLADSKVGVDLKSALSDKVIIEQILIDGPEITYESGPSGNNISKIQQNVAAFGKSAAPKGAAEPKAQKKSQKKVQINEFIFKNGKVSVSAAMFGAKPIMISLPDIHLKDIGKDSGGVTPDTAAAEVFKAIDQAVVQSVTKSAEDAAKNITRAAEGAGAQIGESVKGLFKK